MLDMTKKDAGMPALKDMPQALDKKAQNKEKRIQSVMAKTGWTRKETLAELRDAKARWGITFGDYDRHNLHLLSEEKKAAKCAQIMAKKAQKKHDKAIEEAAMEARKAFIAQPELGQNETVSAEPKGECEELRYQIEEGVEQNAPTDKQPAPIIAACYYLGIPMPEKATCAYQPSAYVSGVSCELFDIRAVLGEKLVPDTETTRKEYAKFKEKFKSCNQLSYNDTDMAVYYTDWLIHGKLQGYNFDDYFDYEFFNKELPVREKYASNGFRAYLKALCNTDVQLFANKANFNDFFRDEIHRDWIDATKADYETFLQFIQRHDQVFAKPIDGTGGGGACVIPTDMMPPEQLYPYCREKNYIMEEIVKQHADMAQFCSDTVNTLRVYSLVDADGNATITGVLGRFGRMGNCVDNFHCGGICTLVDIETGETLDYAVDRAGNHCTEHPDTHFPLKGFIVPNWQQIRQSVMAAAEKCAKLNRHAGWDVAITEAGEAEFIEGNSRPNFDILQAIDKVGKMYRYQEKVDRLADTLGKARYSYPQVTLDVSNMSAEKAALVAKTVKRNTTDVRFQPDVIYAKRHYELKERNYITYAPKKYSDGPFKQPRYVKDDNNVYTKKTESGDTVATLYFTGDLLCQQLQQTEAMKRHNKYDFAESFHYVKPIFEEGTFVTGNLETTLSETTSLKCEESRLDDNHPHNNAPYSFLDALRDANIDMLVTANNHDCDAGVLGHFQTLAHLDRYQFPHTGTFRNKEEKRQTVVEINGMRIGMLSYSTVFNGLHKNWSKEGQEVLLNRYSYKRVCRDVEALKSEGVEFIIAYNHWGTEYLNTVDAEVRTMAQEMADAGVDYIIGSHTHTLQEYNILTAADGRQVPVFYSMGNFVSQMKKPATRETIIAQLKLERKDGKVTIADECYIPCLTVKSYLDVPYVVLPLTKKYRAAFQKDVEDDLNAEYQRIVTLLGDKISAIDDEFYIAPQDKLMGKSQSRRSLLGFLKGLFSGKKKPAAAKPAAAAKSAVVEKPAAPAVTAEKPYGTKISLISKAGIEYYWKKPERANGYEIYRSYKPGDKPELIATIDKRTVGDYTDADFDRSAKCVYYCVRSFLKQPDGTKLYSELTEPVKAVPYSALALEREATYMYDGMQRSIRAFYGWGEPEDAVWTSDNETVATVDGNGMITAVATGVCTLTCTCKAIGQTATTKVEVNRQAPEPLCDEKARFTFDEQSGCWKNTDAAPTGKAEIVMVGDMMCGKRQMLEQYSEADGWNFNESFEYVKELTESADFAIGNLETLLAAGWPYMSEEVYIQNKNNCNAPSRFLDAVRYGGFDAVVMSNNHNCDGGKRALLETIDQVEKYRFANTGVFRDQQQKRFMIVDVNGIKVGYLSYMSRYTGFNGKDADWDKADKDIMINVFDMEKAKRDVAACRAAGAEYIISYMHWGMKNFRKITDKQKLEAQQMADAGADFIVGSNPHLVQIYKVISSADGRKVPCYYSIGNFIALMKQVVGNRDSIMVKICLQRNADGKVELTENSYIPFYTYTKHGGKLLTPICMSKSFNTSQLKPGRDKTVQRIMNAIGDNVPSL